MPVIISRTIAEDLGIPRLIVLWFVGACQVVPLGATRFGRHKLVDAYMTCILHFRFWKMVRTYAAFLVWPHQAADWILKATFCIELVV